MIHLHLSDDEVTVLRQILSSTISDLGMEISHTDSMDFRQGLKRNKALAIEMLDRLEQEPN